MSDSVISQSLKFVAAFSDKAKAATCAASHRGRLLVSSSDNTGHLPFAALFIGVSDDLGSMRQVADVGVYLACERTIKNKPINDLAQGELPGSVGIFTMVAKPGLDPATSDRHWRDQHAPLALEVHAAMTHYYQLSVSHRFDGPEWHGFALCCFNNEDDLRHRFFNSDEGREKINQDVARFADPRRSPRRVIAQFQQ